MASRSSNKSYYTNKIFQGYLSRLGRLSTRLNTKFNGYSLDFISFDEYYKELEHILYQNSLYTSLVALGRLWYTNSMLKRLEAPNVY